jgi:tripartite-type tricarboxylate transporter receptor subunit TctC
MTIRAWMTAVACCLAASASPHAGAQSYPSRVIRIVVPFPPGGPTDVAARLIAQPLGETLGQSVIVENQPGAGGRTGSRFVARATPDGYTLLMGGTNLNAIIPAIYKNLDYDPVRSFTAVASVASDAVIMVINPSVPAKTVAEFVQAAKADPGKLKYGSAPGIASHLASELLKYRAGIDMPFIPYRGGGPAITNLLGGQIFNNKSVLLALIQGEKLRVGRPAPFGIGGGPGAYNSLLAEINVVASPGATTEIDALIHTVAIRAAKALRDDLAATHMIC